jgi:hypothetical protein
MCTEFSLSFGKQWGIVAVLTPEIKEIFGGPEMKDDDTWKMCLGRRIRLDEEDTDGYDFMVGLLEDVLFFSDRPYSPNTSPEWVTYKPTGTTNVWITRPRKIHISYGMSEEVLTDEDNEDQKASDEILDTLFVKSGPTRRTDEYELEDSDGDGDEFEQGYTISLGDDGAWTDGDEGASSGQATDSDSADSDWDSDRTSSGDEDIVCVLELVLMTPGPRLTSISRD